jgi:hypothetical protein
MRDARPHHLPGTGAHLGTEVIVVAVVHRTEDVAQVAWRAFGVFLGVHGLAHLVGTETSFRFADEGGTAHYLGGLWSISDPTVLRVVGVVWVLPAAAFLLAAWGFWIGAPWRRSALVAAAALSTVVCAVALWAAIIGLVIDVALLSFALWLGTHRPRVAEGDLLRPDRGSAR